MIAKKTVFENLSNLERFLSPEVTFASSASFNVYLILGILDVTNMSIA